MRAAMTGALAALALGCEKRAPPRPTPAPVAAPDAGHSVRVDAGPPDAGPTERVVLRLRVKNVDRVPLRILTNPDSNELLHTHRVQASSDRAAMYAGGPRVERVKAFPIGQMPLCTADAGAGYGGLGQPGEVTLAPGESFEAARGAAQRRARRDRRPLRRRRGAPGGRARHRPGHAPRRGAAAGEVTG